VTCRHVAGWDVGGVNTKVARVEAGGIASVCGRPFELQRAPDRLVALLRELASEAGCPGDSSETRHAVTMTAELSQMFRTKREGVAFVLDAIETAFPGSPIRVFAVDGTFLAPADARAEPLSVAAANWSATAHLVALEHPDSLLIDVGTTTTDIIPIVGGRVVAQGRTDPGRLASGELVYTGALRTPAEAIASEIPINGEVVGVSAEGFALAGDVHLWRGDLPPADYTVATPDGRPATKGFAGERLARVICADREMLDEMAISLLADALASAQVQRISRAIRRVAGRHPSVGLAVTTGLGTFLAEDAARLAGLKVVRLATELGEAAAKFAPAAAVALLGTRERQATTLNEPRDVIGDPGAPSDEPRVELVVKIGGALLAQPECLDRVLAIVASASSQRRLVIVPGGGPFAEGVRTVDRELGLSDEAAHWMAVLGMDQYAHLLADRLDGGVVVTSAAEMTSSLCGSRVPVLAPSRWLRDVDPLPHSWEVTSDSIAAWIAGTIGARCLLLVKPSGVSGRQDAVDPYFSRALPKNMSTTIVAADHTDRIRAALNL
jgi:probable H4MPT-linked C1 transfer pathway protein